jgi:hypothetical protein
MSRMASAARLDPEAMDRLPMNEKAEGFYRLRDSLGDSIRV